MHTHRSGSALIEVIISLGILVIFASAFMRLSVSSYDGNRQAREQVIASRYAQQGVEAVRSIAQRDFAELVDGTYGISDLTGVYTLSGSSNVSGKYTRSLSVDTAERTAGDDLVGTGGTEDSDTKSVLSEVSWSVSDGRINTISFFTYLMNWRASASSWVIDSLSDFQDGFFNSSEAVTVDDGDVKLGSMGDLLNPEIYLTEDLSGNGNGSEIVIDAVQDRLYITTSNDNSHSEFWVYDIADVTQGNLTLVGSVDIDNSSNGLVFGDGYAFVLSDDNSQEIRVVDLSNFSIVSTWDIPDNDNPNAIAMSPDRQTLYIVTDDSDSSELYMIDISSPESASIQIADEVEFGENGNDLALYNSTHVFIGTNGNGSELLIVPLDDPDNFSTCNLSGNDDVLVVHVEDNRLFLGRDGDPEFTEYIIDSGDPLNCSLSIAGSVNLSDDAIAIDVDTSTNMAYVTSKSNDLYIIDLSDYSSVTLDIGDECNGVEYYAAYAYIACDDNSDTFRVIRGAPGGASRLSEVGNGNTPGNDNAFSIFYSGDYVYVGTEEDSSDNEFFIFDVSSGVSTSMSPVGSLEIGADINDIYVLGDYAYLATSDNSREFIVIDISAKSSPTELGSFNTDGNADAFSVFVVGTTAYLAMDKSNKDELYILDVATPAGISEIGGYNIGQDANGVWVSGNYAYLATDHNSQELLVLDVSNPSSISYEDALDTSGNTNGEDVWIDGTTAYFVTQDDFYTVDISDPSNIAEQDSLDFGNANNGVTVNADDDIAYVSTGENSAEIRTISIADPENISLIESFDISSNDDALEVATDGTYIFVATQNNSNELTILGPSSTIPTLSHHGSYTSPVFDSEKVGASWQEISWQDTGSSSVIIRLRTSDTLLNIDYAQYVGTDGTHDSVYSIKAGESITTDPNATGTRFAQWKAYFSGSGSQTPIVEDVTLTYQ